MCAKVIHAFNDRGVSSSDPGPRGGRPRGITVEQRARILAVAGARCDTQGGAPDPLFALSRYLAEQQIVVEASPAHLGRILKAASLSF